MKKKRIIFLRIGSIIDMVGIMVVSFLCLGGLLTCIILCILFTLIQSDFNKIVDKLGIRKLSIILLSPLIFILLTVILSKVQNRITTVSKWLEVSNDFNSIIKILDKAYEENSEESLFYIGEDGSIWRSYADSYTVINGQYISSEKYLELSEQEKNMIKKLKNSHNYSENGFEYICRFENNYRFNINETTYYELVYLRDDTKENVKNLKERNSHWADAVVKLAPHWYQVAGPH